jgi:uncharacterized membrane protein YfcA
VQGTIGFGLNLLAAPILTLVDPTFVPGPALAAGLVHTMLMTVADHRSIVLSEVGWATSGRLIGTLAGASALTVLAAHQANLWLGLLVLLAVALSASGVPITPTRRTLFGAGCLSGLMGTMTSVGGPPLALVYQHSRGGRLRGSLGGQFLVGAAMSLAALIAFGHYGRAEALATIVLAPGAVVGWAISLRLRSVADFGYARPVILALAAGAAAVVVVRELF